LSAQVADVRGGGSENTELAKPQLVFSSFVKDWMLSLISLLILRH
jgi:hypothetical protein